MRLNLYFTIFHYKQFRLLKLNAVLDKKNTDRLHKICETFTNLLKLTELDEV